MVKDGIYLGKRYEVLSKIGAGGMADVYKGKDHMLNRYVAIKVLKREFREDSGFVKKFKSEAQAAAGLMHPNIVNVYDVGEDRGLYYMVMELVEGITLKDYIDKKGRLSAKEVISIAIQMCNGIEAAHGRQIVHRDIKPHNVIISREGKVKVTDFGIAKATTSATVSTSAMGSVHYTSPEQARGGYVDTKSDIYSIGITLYEMVTGKVPFNGESAVEVAVKHLQEEIVPPSEIVPDIPYSLEQIILKCTQKISERRYGNIAELIQDLKRALIDPDGDFVRIAYNNADTVILSEDDLGDIRDSYSKKKKERYDDDGYEDEYEDEYEDGYDEEYEEDYDDDDYDDKREHEEEVNPRMNKIMKIMTIVVAVLVLLVLGVVVGKATGLLKFGQGITAVDSEGRVKVPALVGRTEGEAKSILEEAGFRCVVAERRSSKKYKEGLVIEQNPVEGKKLKKGSDVEIVVSSGIDKEEIPVPDVEGRDEEEAQKILEDAGFKNITSEAVYSEEEQGVVIGTDPTAGTKVDKNTTIKMKVSKGSEKIPVPNVVGKSENDAKSEITDAGLTISTVETEYSESYETGLVIRQDPAGGKVEKGSSVSLVVSLGKKPEEKPKVPSIVGASESSAKQMIINAGLTVSDTTYISSDTVPAGCVISCSPGVGTELSKGASVSIVISTGAAPEEQQ
ncbi:MAG: Stk1 family PASTA domain-containing Ser/Thr kinase [Eubacteriales bacterium]|nr:Stk1 family PASTA domain-containing Ser/Thr kinase [Eubacteriales bacterium]